jgi:hypothetical protein
MPWLRPSNGSSDRLAIEIARVWRGLNQAPQASAARQETLLGAALSCRSGLIERHARVARLGSFLLQPLATVLG